MDKVGGLSCHEARLPEEVDLRNKFNIHWTSLTLLACSDNDPRGFFRTDAVALKRSVLAEGMLGVLAVYFASSPFAPRHKGRGKAMRNQANVLSVCRSCWKPSGPEK